MKHYIIATALAALTLTACSNDAETDLFESPAIEEGTGTITNSVSTISALEFDWKPVDRVYQYGYTLTSADGIYNRTGVTQDTHLRFENLERATTYNLTVEAYGFNGESTHRFHATATTADYVTLATPDLSALNVNVESPSVTLSWPAVDHASSYDYVLYDSEGEEITEGTVAESVITFTTLPAGVYTLEVTAYSDEEGFLTSEKAAATFTREAVIVATFTGTYKSILLDSSYECTMNQYDNGTYTIVAFCGVEGYDLQFSLGAGNVVSILNYLDADARTIATGLADIPTLTVNSIAYGVVPGGKKRITIRTTVGNETFTW